MIPVHNWRNPRNHLAIIDYLDGISSREERSIVWGILVLHTQQQKTTTAEEARLLFRSAVSQLKSSSKRKTHVIIWLHTILQLCVNTIWNSQCYKDKNGNKQSQPEKIYSIFFDSSWKKCNSTEIKVLKKLCLNVSNLPFLFTLLQFLETFSQSHSSSMCNEIQTT